MKELHSKKPVLVTIRAHLTTVSWEEEARVFINSGSRDLACQQFCEAMGEESPIETCEEIIDSAGNFDTNVLMTNKQLRQLYEVSRSEGIITVLKVNYLPLHRSFILYSD